MSGAASPLLRICRKKRQQLLPLQAANNLFNARRCDNLAVLSNLLLQQLKLRFLLLELLNPVLSKTESERALPSAFWLLGYFPSLPNPVVKRY